MRAIAFSPQVQHDFVYLDAMHNYEAVAQDKGRLFVI